MSSEEVKCLLLNFQTLQPFHLDHLFMTCALKALKSTLRGVVNLEIKYHMHVPGIQHTCNMVVIQKINLDITSIVFVYYFSTLNTV